MQWCQPHWDALRAEVTRQGLMGFVPETGEQAADIMARVVEGEESVDAFDPLMNAMWAINAFIAAPDDGGPGVMAVLALDGCPVCKANSVHEEFCTEEGCTYKIDNFFVNAVQDQRGYLEELKH